MCLLTGRKQAAFCLLTASPVPGHTTVPPPTSSHQTTQLKATQRCPAHPPAPRLQTPGMLRSKLRISAVPLKSG